MTGERAPVLLFDGECGLCHRAVRFVLAHDDAERFRFAPLGSEAGERLLREAGLSLEGRDTMVLVDERGRAFVRSSAALRVATRLGWPWRAAGVFLAVPPLLRDPVYRFVARHRYRWFGSADACEIGEADLGGRLLTS